ncbi:hypothetical protein RchiOBHm_Chr3g0479081 [Rosa chinensis]|uniref:Uncharacterized protein n=1 Tax=Rosa chinensis TaxID=74649 RepID=A0A2P6RDC3_ROSCH|nr:hypothetical protein RchiOBHm_Chr3g0479081 [Rosa chinensis]
MNGVDAGAAYNPQTVKEIFRDFRGCRISLIKALTTGLLPIPLFNFCSVASTLPFENTLKCN